MGSPKVPIVAQNPPKASPRCLSMASRRRLFTKRGDLHETSLFTMFEAHSAGPRSSLGYSFGPQSRPMGAPMPLLGRLGRSLKNERFFGGVSMLTLAPKLLHFGSYTGGSVDPFLVPFSRGYPQIARYPKK